MSWRAFNVLPYLARHFDITYITTGDEIPPADFKDVRRFPRWRHMMLGGFSLSNCVDQLYTEARIQLAVVYASIGFAIRRAPYVTIEGGSVYRELQLFSSRVPWYRRAGFGVGFLHYALPEMRCVRRAIRVFVNSHALGRDLMEIHRLSPSKIEVIYNGLGADFLALNERRPEPSPLRLLYVGRLHQRKGILAALQAFSHRRDLDTEFTVIGSGPDAAAVNALAARDPRIRVLGEVSHDVVKQALCRSHVFVFPSFYEGFPSALLEAMAAGLACVTYDIPVMQEALGDAGCLVPAGDNAALLDSVAHLVSNPEIAVGLGVRAHARAARLSWEQCARDFEDSLDRVLSKLPPTRNAIHSMRP